MTKGDRWELLVIGGGTAGIVGAQTAAALGSKVALVERARTGGDCLWTGCVPSKALIAAARYAADARRAPALGVHTGEVTVDFAAVMAHVKRARERIEPDDSPETLTAAGVRVISGAARFSGPDRVEIGGRETWFDRALLATGSEPVVLPVPGLSDAEPLTSETVWELAELPERLLVVGGGTIGCELAQAFGRLGSRVCLLEEGPRLLAREDPDASAVVTAAMTAEGIDVRTGARLAGVRDGVATIDGPSGEDQVAFDEVLVAVGRRPRTEGLGLDGAGIRCDESGHVVVDAHLRTSNPRVWAAGDVTTHPKFTHVAGVHASIAVPNALLGLRRRVDPEAVPRVTFTDPEVAHVGRPSWSPDGAEPTTRTVRLDTTDRAITEGRAAGFSRLVLDGRRIVGATVVGPRAGEALAELGVAVTQGMSTSDLTGTMHAYPTYADAAWNAAVGHVRHSLAARPVQSVSTVVRGVRRLWSRRSG